MIDYAIWIFVISAYVAGCGVFFFLSVKNFWFDTGSTRHEAVAVVLFTAIWPISTVFYFGMKLTKSLADR